MTSGGTPRKPYEIGFDPDVDVVVITPDGRVFVRGEKVNVSDVRDGDSERRRATEPWYRLVLAYGAAGDVGRSAPC